MGASEALDGGRAWAGDLGGGAEVRSERVFRFGRTKIRSLWLEVNNVT